MGRILIILTLILSTPAPSFAGAWLREKGKAFTALSVTAYKDEDGFYDSKTSIYAEYALRPGITIGLDAEENQNYYGHALIFARLPIADFDHSGRFAAELGVGVHHRHLRSWALYKATLSYGKGFHSRWGNGWVALDAIVEHRTHEATIHKLDFTAGLNSNRWLDPLLQIETSHASGSSPYWSIRPAVLIRPRKRQDVWLLGVERNSYRNRLGIKFALWREF